MRRAVALYGMSGAGKTTVAEYLVQQHGFKRIATGEACRQICKLLFDSEAKTILNRVTDALRLIDQQVWIRTAFKNDHGNQDIVFDSMRFGSDYTFLASKGFVKWKVEAPQGLRITRLSSRGQEYNPEIDDHHAGETSLNAYPYDSVIVNAGDCAELYAAVERALARSFQASITQQ